MREYKRKGWISILGGWPGFVERRGVAGVPRRWHWHLIAEIWDWPGSTGKTAPREREWKGISAGTNSLSNCVEVEIAKNQDWREQQLKSEEGRKRGLIIWPRGVILYFFSSTLQPGRLEAKEQHWDCLGRNDQMAAHHGWPAVSYYCNSWLWSPDWAIKAGGDWDGSWEHDGLMISRVGAHEVFSNVYASNCKE